MPWAGFFNLMALSDLYIVLDHVQFKKRYFENRNQIISPKGEAAYVGVPVITKNRYYQSICDVEIDNTKHWKKKLLLTIYHCYKKAPFFSNYYDEIDTLITENKYIKLLSLNMEIIYYFRKCLNINTPIKFSSDMDVASVKGSDLILKICQIHDATTYLSGKSGRDYLKTEQFKAQGIYIKWIDYNPFPYKQQCKTFVSNMSILDLLFNHGEDSLNILLTK